MQVVRVCLAVACLLPCALPAVAADTKPPPGQVVRVPPEDVMPVLGTPIAGPDGKTIGRLVDVLVNAAGIPEAAVIDVGGFMGVGSRKIAVHWGALHFDPGDQKQPITLALTLDQIKAEPEYRSPKQPAPIVVAPHARPTAPVARSTGTSSAGRGTSSPGNGGPASAAGTTGAGPAATAGGAASGHAPAAPAEVQPANGSGPLAPAAPPAAQPANGSGTGPSTPAGPPAARPTNGSGASTAAGSASPQGAANAPGGNKPPAASP
ncbi:MAG TPA: PRC-barrel domain-containing protein [Acetobacteraceae bacterium]|nr:PRC-barrel domain-containing protein [Acetobacteraceae bacterium]